SSNPVSMQGGKLTGAGTLSGNLTTSDDNNQNTPPATIAPGVSDPNEPTANPIGILTLDGNLTLDASAVLEAELAGTSNADPNNPQYDQLRIAGSGFTRTVQLAGTLRLKGRNNFVPTVGGTFDVIVRTASGWNRTGTFSRVEVDLNTLPCTRAVVRYLSDRVRVEVIRLADVNADGCVNDADLLAVLLALGQTGGSAADANCDGVVNDVDLLAVLVALGQGC
ncbi:MAG: dockerin type I domain-containing protein, partial [Fimbriimonadales bacterium]|nr:dockerin type I domain-containing protein [Fimbriimonadales bacterium]